MLLRRADGQIDFPAAGDAVRKKGAREEQKTKQVNTYLCDDEREEAGGAGRTERGRNGARFLSGAPEEEREGKDREKNRCVFCVCVCRLRLSSVVCVGFLKRGG
jgi:hypothetical protein